MNIRASLALCIVDYTHATDSERSVTQSRGMRSLITQHVLVLRPGEAGVVMVELGLASVDLEL